MPELDFGLTESPAQQHAAASHQRWKIDQSLPAILELNTKRLELTLAFVDLARQGLSFALELLATVVRLIRALRQRNVVERDNRLSPTLMQTDDVRHDPSDERQCAIGLFDGEELHLVRV